MLGSYQNKKHIHFLFTLTNLNQIFKMNNSFKTIKINFYLAIIIQF